MAHIHIYIGRHLCTAPRAVKEADALAASGHDVSVHGFWFDPRLVARDQQLVTGRPWRFAPYADCQPLDRQRSARWLKVRLRHRLARLFWQYLRLVRIEAFGYDVSSLFRHALAQPADLTIFHSEGGLVAARRLRQAGRRVGVDFEDWFSRSLPANKPAALPNAALAQAEVEALRLDTYLLTTTNALARALATESGGREPEVVYNTFPEAPSPGDIGLDRKHVERVSLHWFSQTLGPLRGLENLFQALPALRFPWELNLRADDPRGYFPTLLSHLPPPLHRWVRLHSTVANAELPARIRQHDIGLALEPGFSPNNELTASNKLFQYLQAGLAVVASDTTGQREVMASVPDGGAMFPRGSASGLAVCLGALGENPTRLAAAKAAARRAHSSAFAPDTQASRYTDLAASALAS